MLEIFAYVIGIFLALGVGLVGFALLDEADGAAGEAGGVALGVVGCAAAITLALAGIGAWDGAMRAADKAARCGEATVSIPYVGGN